jgi:hypothetical protein
VPPISKADLLKPRIEHGTVAIEGLGEFTIRPLTRAEAFDVQTMRDESVLAAENLLISLGLVDPEMTVEEVDRWSQVAPAGHLAAVSMAIGRISGMMPESGKESYKSPRGES